MMASGLRSAPELEGVSCQLAVALRGADARPTNLQKEDVRERGAAGGLGTEAAQGELDG